jgi:hypothetical protein
MSKYASMFGSEPAPVTKSNLFGDTSQPVDRTAEIEAWRVSKGPMETSAKRINFILNGVDVKSLALSNIGDVGGHQVEEATECNKCVDAVVTDFAALKEALAEPKNLVISATSIIEEAAKPLTFLEKMKGVKRDDWKTVRTKVSEAINKANDLMISGTKYHIDPFIEGLGDALATINAITKDMNNSINALDYVAECCPDKTVQDFALRRKAMFAKSLALMGMNRSQVDQMTQTCQKNKDFGIELTNVIKPLLENIMRTAIISDSDDAEAMKQMQLKLKGIL